MNIDQQKKISALEMIVMQKDEQLDKQKYLIIGLVVTLVGTVGALVYMLAVYT